MPINLDLNTITLLIVAILNGTTLYYTHRTEKNTNSMKDALVESTRKESLAKGAEDQRIIGEAKAAALAEHLKN
jgi:hypothetical protein